MAVRKVEPADERSESEDTRDLWVDRWLLPYVRESTLWPVLIVILCHAAVFVAPVLVLAVRERRVTAILALLMLFFLSFRTLRFEWTHYGGLGALSAVIGVTWALSTAAAWAAHHYGIF